MPQLLEGAPGLTTSRAPFIEKPRSTGSCISNSRMSFTPLRTTRRGVSCTQRMTPDDGSDMPTSISCEAFTPLCLNPDRVPRLQDVNRFLCPLTGFQAKAVSGYIPAFLFFDSPAQYASFRPRSRFGRPTVSITCPSRTFFTTSRVMFRCTRIAAFADTLVRFGECAHTAAELVSAIARPTSSPGAAEQHYPCDGALLLVHDRVWTHEHPAG